MKQQPARKSSKVLGSTRKKEPLRRRLHTKPVQIQQPRPSIGIEDMVAVLDNMPVMLVALDENFHITYWNHEVERLTGYDSHEIGHHSNWFYKIFPDEIYRLHNLNKLLNNIGEFRNWEWEIVCKDGSHKTISLSSISALYPIPGWTIWAIGHDVSRQKSVEDDLREALVWSNSILETSMSGYFTFRMDGRIESCNESFCQQTGFSREVLLTKKIYELQIDLTPEELDMQLDRIIGRGRHRFEAAFQQKNGKTCLLEINASFLFTDDGGRFVCFARDITWRKESEKALRQSEENYRLIADNIDDVIWTLDLKGNFNYISPSIERLSGFTAQEVMKNGLKIILPEDSLRVLRNIILEVQMKIENCRPGQQPRRLEFQHMHKNGSLLWVEVLISVIFNEHGDCYGILGVTRDIHHRKMMEISEQEQRRLAEALAASAAALNSRLDKNEVLKQILISIGDVVAHDSSNFSIIDPDSGAIHVIRVTVKPGKGFDIIEKELEFGLDDLPNLRKMYDSGEPLICYDTLKDPNWRNYKHVGNTRSYAGVPVRIKGETAGFLNLESYTPDFFNEEHAYRLKIFADQAATAIENAQLFETALKQLIERERIARSEHEQRILAEALRASSAVLNSTLDLEELLRRILEEAGRVVPHDSADIILIDDNKKIVSVTTGKGYPPITEELDHMLINKNISEFHDLDNVYNTHQPLIIDDVQKYRGWVPNSTIPWKRSQVVTPIFVQEAVTGFINLGSAEPGFFSEDLVERLVFFADHAATAIQNAALYASLQYELDMRQKMQENLLTSQKLAALGTMAAGIAHEINSPLQTITGISDSLLNRLEKNQLDIDELPAQMQMISRNSWRVASIVQSILTYARASKDITEPVDINHLVTETIELTRQKLRIDSDIRFQVDLAQTLPSIYCDREQISLVLVNLLSNACDSMPGGGSITVSTTHLSQEQRVILRISDTGKGIDPEIVNRIFDPFFTTKPVGQGTGLGLAISLSIINAHNGDIELESTPGSGSTFIVSLPDRLSVSSQDAQLNQYGRYQDAP